MSRKKLLKEGYIYYLKDFTAPKVFTGSEFVCLLTDQKISKDHKIVKDTGIHISEWGHEVWAPIRFNRYLATFADPLRLAKE